jgi:hypothetical protein
MRAQTATLQFKLLSFLLLSLALNIACANDAKQLPEQCRIDCTTPYGETLGASSDGVEAYSNCRSGCVNPEHNTLKHTYTGIKWQCVEYARRWLLANKGAVYGDVNTAADIWNEINYLTDVSSNRSLPLESRANGSANPPQTGDLLVYASAFHGTGHVAVVTAVDEVNGLIEVGEQNYSNEPWPGDFARKIELVRKGADYWLMDEYLIGWKHITDTSGPVITRPHRKDAQR